MARENNTLSLSGTATTDSVVAVKGRTATAGRQGRFWSDEVTVSNVLGPWAGPLAVYATNPAGGSNVMRIDSRAAQLPAVSQSFSYDLDGNTLSDGIWEYQWDAENRLVRLETTVAARTAGFAHRILNFTYDYLGRRVQKQVMDGVTSTEISSQRFIYNGWDVIAEYSVSAGTTLDKLQRTYAWGIDLASSLTKAGGVGALLQFANTPTGQSYLPTYDGNGNVASLVNLGTGALAAAYEYTPFGEMLRDEVLDNAVSTYAFKFSSKWWDAETGWSYYGRRYYDARMGRFVGRDPIGEEGGINLYAFVRNNPVDRWDMLGMEDPVTFDPFEYLASLPENLRNDLQLRLATNTGLADWFFGGQGSYFDDEGDEMNLGNLFGDGSMNLMYDGIASGTIDSFGVSNAMIAGRQLDLLAEAARNLQVPNSGGLAAIGKASQFGTGTLLKPGAVPEVDAMLTNDNVVNQLGVLYGLNQNYGIQQNGGNVSVTEFFATINGTSATSNTLYGNTITLSSTDFDAGGWTASVTPRFTMVDLTAVAHTHPINGVPSDGHDFAFQLPVLSSSGVWSIIVTPSNVYFTGPQQGQYYYLPASDFINAGKANNTTVTIPAQPLPGP